MTVREFMNLAVILLLGLMVNHCAFRNDVTEVGGNERSLRAIGERLDRQSERLQDNLDQTSQELEQKMERLDQRMEDIGERTDSNNSETGADPARQIETTTTRQENPTGDVNLNLAVKLRSAAGGEKVIFSENPAETLILLGAGESGKLTLDLAGKSAMETPDIHEDDSGRISIGYCGEVPAKVQAALPQGIAELIFGEDEAVLLALEPSGAVLHLDSAVGKLNIKRSGEWVTLSHQDWSIRIKGLSTPLSVVDADGTELGKLDAGKAAKLSIVLGNEGGAQ
jgi:uncharacterized protein YukE